jgi:quercetin dioxygenase-like cupin family protein
VLPGEPVIRHAHPKAHVTVITGHVIAKCDRGDFELRAGEGHVAVFIVAPGESHSLHAVTPSAYACVGEEGFDL